MAEGLSARDLANYFAQAGGETGSLYGENAAWACHKQPVAA
jgi:hypothetical protein